MPIRPRKITGSRCASRTTDLEKAIVRADSPLKQSYVRLRVSNRNPRHPNTLAKSPAQCEIFMQKDVYGFGRGALQSPCAPQPWPSGRVPRPGFCPQACLVNMSASTVPLHLTIKITSGPPAVPAKCPDSDRALSVAGSNSSAVHCCPEIRPL